MNIKRSRLLHKMYFHLSFTLKWSLSFNSNIKVNCSLVLCPAASQLPPLHSPSSRFSCDIAKYRRLMYLNCITQLLLASENYIEFSPRFMTRLESAFTRVYTNKQAAYKRARVCFTSCFYLSENRNIFFSEFIHFLIKIGIKNMIIMVVALYVPVSKNEFEKFRRRYIGSRGYI